MPDGQALETLDRLKTKLLTDAAHELRRPLAPIVSAAEIINKHHADKPEVVERFTGIILDEGHRLNRLLNDLLDLTKLEPGSVVCDDERVFVDDVDLVDDDVLRWLVDLKARGVEINHADRVGNMVRNPEFEAVRSQGQADGRRPLVVRRAGCGCR